MRRDHCPFSVEYRPYAEVPEVNRDCIVRRNLCAAACPECLIPQVSDGCKSARKSIQQAGIEYRVSEKLPLVHGAEPESLAVGDSRQIAVCVQIAYGRKPTGKPCIHGYARFGSDSPVRIYFRWCCGTDCIGPHGCTYALRRH